MARRPFRIVADLNISGNNILGVKTISRLDHETLDKSLTIYSGSGAAVPGGDLNLYSGAGTTPGAIKLFLGKDDVSKYGIEIAGSSVITLKTADQDITLSPGSAAVKILAEANAISNVSGALQITGGLYLGKDLLLSGNIVTDSTTISLLNTTATTVAIAGAATTLTIANTAVGAQTISIGTAVTGSTTQLIELGGATSSGTVRVGSTKDADASDAALVIAGGTLVSKQLVGLTGLSLPNSSSSNVLALGTVNLYEDENSCLSISACVAFQGAELTGPSELLLAKNTTTLVIGAETGTTTIRNALVVEGSAELKGALPYVYLAPQAAAPSNTEGLLYYSSIEKSLNYVTDIADVTVNLGFESVIRVGNHTGVLIPNGTPVYLTGAVVAGVPDCAPAQANSNVTARLIGITTTDIADSAEGYASVQGIIRGVDTSAFSAGDLLYLSDVTPGAFTSAAPSSSGSYVIKAARVLVSGVSGTLLASIGLAWSDTATFNNVRIDQLAVATALSIPVSTTPTQIEAGSLVWDSAQSRLTVGAGSERVTLVDEDSTQALTNKTINGLTINESSGALTIANGFELDIQADFTASGGDITITGDAGGQSGLVLPNTTITLTALTEGHFLYASAADTISGMAALDAPRGGTGIYSYAVGDILVASATDALATVSIGTANQLLGVAASGTGLEYKTLTGGGDILISNEAGVIEIATSQSIAPDSNVNFASLTLSGYLAVNGGIFSSTATEFSLLDENVTTLNMLGEAGATLNIGIDDANLRTVNVFADMQIGSVITPRTVDHYGQFNFGGPAGFTLLWNAGDNSLDFVKL